MTPIYNWTLGKFAPNLANMVRKLFQTRIVKTPRSAFYKNTPINKWPKDGPAIVTQKIPVSFTKQGRPFEQTYTWSRKLGEIQYKPAALKKGSAKFLPKEAKVGPSIAGERLKEAGKLSIVGTTGTALALTPRPSKDSTGPASVRTRQFKPVAPRKVSVATTASSGKGGRMQTAPTKVTPVAKAVKTTAKPGGAKWTSPSGKQYDESGQRKLRGMGVAHSQGKLAKAVTKSATKTTKVKKSVPVPTTEKARKATEAGLLTASIIRKFGITSEQIKASDISQRKRLEKERGGSIAGPKKATGFKSPFEGDIAKRAASGYHIFKQGSKGALSFQAAYKAAKGKKFKWKGTGKWYK